VVLSKFGFLCHTSCWAPAAIAAALKYIAIFVYKCLLWLSESLKVEVSLVSAKDKSYELKLSSMHRVTTCSRMPGTVLELEAVSHVPGRVSPGQWKVPEWPHYSADFT